MRYNFRDIAALTHVLQENVQLLITRTDDLDQAAQHLGFSDGDRVAYQQYLASWKSEITEAQQLLTKIANTLHRGGQRMRQADPNNARRSDDTARVTALGCDAFGHQHGR